MAFVLSNGSPWIAFISSLVSNEQASKGVLADETAGDELGLSAWAWGGAGVSDFEQPDKAATRHANNERKELLRILESPISILCAGERPVSRMKAHFYTIKFRIS
jgi:hypothetical protein